MGLLSRQFRGDPKLEACLTDDRAHILSGCQGGHVKKIQQAVFSLDGGYIAADERDKGYYGPTTADAVLAYKKKRNIINLSYQTKADNIVGKMTIAALDRELFARGNQKAKGGFYAGIHTLSYPGKKDMEWLMDNTNLSWTGFYLSPTPSHKFRPTWMEKWYELKQLGWGIVPIYVGQQEKGGGAGRHPSKKQGEIDGAEAVGLVRKAHFPDMSVLYLDIEGPPPFNTPKPSNIPMIDYFKAWADAVTKGFYYPGIYCSSLWGDSKLFPAYAKALEESQAFVWAAKGPHGQNIPLGGQFKNEYPVKDPSTSGNPRARSWHWSLEANLEGPSGKWFRRFDLDSSLTSDPSAIIAG